MRETGPGRQLARRLDADAGRRARCGAERSVRCGRVRPVAGPRRTSARGRDRSQTPIDTNATSSNRARVISPAVRTTIPAASSATHTAVARRKPRLQPGSARALTTIARKERPRPLAMMSCITGLTGIGTRPTAVRCSPAETTEPRNARAARRPVCGGSATARNTPYAARKNPENITVVLNVRAEKSVNVPSCEKWWCHHSGSCVVSAATITPTGSDSTARRPMPCATASCAGSAPERAGRGEGTGVDTATSTMAPMARGAGGASDASARVVGGMRLTIGSVAHLPVPGRPQRDPTPGPASTTTTEFPSQRQAASSHSSPDSGKNAGCLSHR